jgi:hypothetical protein
MSVDFVKNVVVLSGAASLTQDELNDQVKKATVTLDSKLGVVVNLPYPSHLTAVIVKQEGVPTMFIGLGLEVIQAVQNWRRTER